MHTRFQTWPLERNYDISTYIIERKQKDSSNPFRICIFLFLSHSFGIETTNTFIRSEIPSKTIPDSRPKWEKCIPVYRPKGRKNPTRWGGTYLYGLYTGVPRPRAWGDPNTCSLCFNSCKRQIPIRNTRLRLDILEGLSLEF